MEILKQQGVIYIPNLQRIIVDFMHVGFFPNQVEHELSEQCSLLWGPIELRSFNLSAPSLYHFKRLKCAPQHWVDQNMKLVHQLDEFKLFQQEKRCLIMHKYSKRFFLIEISEPCLGASWNTALFGTDSFIFILCEFAYDYSKDTIVSYICQFRLGCSQPVLPSIPVLAQFSIQNNIPIISLYTQGLWSSWGYNRWISIRCLQCKE